jgi:integrase
MQRLTDARVRQAKPKDKSFKLTDGHGLVLLVKPNGKKVWRYRYRLLKENMFAIGEYPAVSIKDARIARDRARVLVERGVHPAHQRKADRLVRHIAAGQTFETVAATWIEQNRKKWSSTYLGQVQNVLEHDVYPAIGGMPVSAVKSAHLYSIVMRVAGRGAETVAILIRQWCSAIFRHAAAAGLVEFDPTTALRGAIARDEVQHKRPMTQVDIAAFVRRLSEKDDGTPEVRIALRLLLLTFVRPGELRGARWSEFDLAARRWTIPADRMKMRQEHLVPLSRQTISCLRKLKAIRSSKTLLFPNRRDPRRFMSPTTLNRRLERLGYGNRFSAHGFRATASTLLNELGFRADIIERQLAHAERNRVRASYNHAQHLDVRAEMMQAWANFIDDLVAGRVKNPSLRRRAA